MSRTNISPFLAGSGGTRLARVLALLVLVLAAALLTTAAAAGARSGAVIKVGRSSLGQILVDSHGRTLYLWAHDKHHRSTCYGACAAYWPPLTTRGKPRATGGARQALLSTTRRRDGGCRSPTAATRSTASRETRRPARPPARDSPTSAAGGTLSRLRGPRCGCRR